MLQINLFFAISNLYSTALFLFNIYLLVYGFQGIIYKLCNTKNAGSLVPRGFSGGGDVSPGPSRVVSILTLIEPEDASPSPEYLHSTRAAAFVAPNNE